LKKDDKKGKRLCINVARYLLAIPGWQGSHWQLRLAFSKGVSWPNASVEYLLKMVKVVRDDFKITVWESVTGFRKFPELAKELAENCGNMGLTFRRFGDFEPETYVGTEILSEVSKGLALEDCDRGPRKRLIRELNINFRYD